MLSRELIRHITGLARLELSDNEEKKIQRDLSSILDAFKLLDEADTSKVEPAHRPIETKNVMREDKVEECLTNKEALENTRHKEEGYFKGPRTV